MKYIKTYEGRTNSDKIIKYVIHGNLSKVKELIDLDPKLINTVDENNTSILALALDCHDDEHRKIALFLIDKNCDIESSSNLSTLKGYTPILWATHKGNKDAIIALIKKGAKIDQVANDGMNIFDLDVRIQNNIKYANKIDYKIWETEEVQEAVIKYQLHMFDFIINNVKVHPNIEKKYPELISAHKYNL